MLGAETRPQGAPLKGTKLSMLISDFSLHLIKVKSMINIEISNFYIHRLKMSMSITDLPYVFGVKYVINMKSSNFLKCMM